MKETVRIAKADNNKICLFSLRKKFLKNFDIVAELNDNNHLKRVTTTDQIDKAIANPDIVKVLAVDLSGVGPCISLAYEDATRLQAAYDQGLEYVEIECHEDGYPVLTNHRMTIYDFSSFALDESSIILTPTEALERIKQFNEKYTNNHKLTPGLHESS